MKYLRNDKTIQFPSLLKDIKTVALLVVRVALSDHDVDSQMKTKRHNYRFIFLVILLVIPILFSCNSGVDNYQLNEQICVVLAHPDDETIISGTLAMLASKGCSIKVIYVTSGGEGPDGITGARDHIMTGFDADSAFDLTDSWK